MKYGKNISRQDKNMPLPNPKPQENKDEFLSRCIKDDTMRSEFPDGKQRFVVCLQQYENK